MKQGNNVTYLHGDHLGSTSVTSGANISTQTYYAYGAVRTASGTLPTDYTFTGQKIDASAGLMYYNARYYDAALGRFIQPDRILPNLYDPQQLNRYTYTRNNPLRYTDPSGQFVPAIIGVMFIGAGVFALVNEVNQINNHAQSQGIGFWDAVSSPNLHLDQGSMIKSAVDGAVAAGLAVEGGIALIAGGGLAAQELGMLANNPRVFGAGTQMLNTAAMANAALWGTTPVQTLRDEYESKVRALSGKADEMRAAGYSSENIARALHSERRALGVRYKNLTPPDKLEQIYQRNIEKYGDPLGPSIDWLLDQGKSWDDIIESAARPGGTDIVPKLLREE